MVTTLATKIKEQVGCNYPATEAEIKICNLKLNQEHLPELPLAFCDLLKTANGFSNEDFVVFGAETGENRWFRDLVAFNVSYFHGQPKQWLILGESDFSFFIYDAEQKKYYVVDRDTMEEEYSDENLDLVIENFLLIE